MIVVIQCAASKRAGAGHLVSGSGKPVVFVAEPQDAPADPAHAYARPDDPSGDGTSWRQALVKYNEEDRNNPLCLYPAWQLYENKTYGRLVDRLGLQNVYILSAGWGLIRADFLTPYYDITFSPSAERYKRRRKADPYQDFRMLPDTTDDEILFFGGKDYLPLFCSLTYAIRSCGFRKFWHSWSTGSFLPFLRVLMRARIFGMRGVRICGTHRSKKTAFYNSARRPPADGCTLERYETTTRTNWHYECANAFLDETLIIKGRNFS